MPSDPSVFDELKLPFIFVPHGEPEPTEWLATHPNYIKLPATFVPRAQGSGGSDPSSGSPPPGQRRTLDGRVVQPYAGAPRPPAGNTAPDATQTAPNEAADRASISDNPIAAFRQANDALATVANGYASGPVAGSDASTGSAEANDAPGADQADADASQSEEGSA